MDNFPNIPRTSTGEILMQDSRQAREVAAKKKTSNQPKALPLSQVQQHAKEIAKQHGLSDPTLFQLRGFYELQFGKYRGQTFHWLVENAVGYASYIVNSSLKEGDASADTPLGQNKRELRLYMESFPDGRRALQQKAAEQQRRRPAQTLQPAPVAKVPKTSSVEVTPVPVVEKSNPVEFEDIGDVEFMSMVEEMEAKQTDKRAPTLVTLQASRADFPLPEGWKQTLPKVDQQWVSRALFRYTPSGKVELNPGKLTGLWYYPPQPSLTPGLVPKVDRYFASPLFLWMPRKLWKVSFVCPVTGCSKELTSAGLYQNVRSVLDLDRYYSLATEYLECSRCKRKFAAWSGAILNQLDIGHRYMFPALLTYRAACDVRVVTLMRQRGLGNSSMQLERKLREEHSEAWLKRVNHYLSDCKAIVDADSSKLVVRPVFEDPPPLPSVPRYCWLQTVYCNDVMRRIDEVKASITSTFGRVLKLDSTKKVAKKLAGMATGTATWATNVGNEHGQVLISVLTCAEGYGLGPMLHGLINRYSDAGEVPPEILYVDRDCCGPNLVQRMLSAWPDIRIRLDIWHFMRRFASGCTTDSHQLYGVFMSRLSQCIFEWSSDDLELLREAKRSELAQKHVVGQSDKDIIGQLSRKELALHCRRRTRGIEETTRLLDNLIETFMSDQGLDSLGVPLFDKERMANIWESQKRHVACIQDPEGVQLYTVTGSSKKGSARLPTYRCARGSTSLESFHLHLARFIPGTVASDVHFQMYLLDGLARWNEDRVRQSTADLDNKYGSSYSGLLKHSVNVLSEQVLHRKLVPEFEVPRKFTGEKIGVEYLYSQTGETLQDFPLDPDHPSSAQFEPDQTITDDDDVDEGIGEEEAQDFTVPLPVAQPTQPSGFQEPAHYTEPATSLIGDKQRPTAKRLKKTATLTATTTTTTHIRDTQQVDQPVPTGMVPKMTSIGDQQREDLPPQTGTATSGEQQPTDPSVDDSVGPDNIRGFQQVEELANYLFGLRTQELRSLSSQQVDEIVRLWTNLSDYDKQRSATLPRHQTQIRTGRFKAKRATSSELIPGVDTTKRCFLGQGSGPASRPDANRYMEALIIKLSQCFRTPVKEDRKTVQRWTRITRAYSHIREIVLDNARVMSETFLALPAVNNATIIKWYNDRTKKHERQILEQGLRIPVIDEATKEPLPPPREQLTLAQRVPIPPEQRHDFVLPSNTTGMASTRRHLFTPPDTQAHPDTPADSGTCIDLQRKPRSTAWYQRKQQKKEQAGESVRRYKPRSGLSTCGKCGKLRTPETHSQYYGSWFCAETATESLEQWRSSKEKCRQQGEGSRDKMGRMDDRKMTTNY